MPLILGDSMLYSYWSLLLASQPREPEHFRWAGSPGHQGSKLNLRVQGNYILRVVWVGP
jgi:hypothetical protein